MSKQEHKPLEVLRHHLNCMQGNTCNLHTFSTCVVSEINVSARVSQTVACEPLVELRVICNFRSDLFLITNNLIYTLIMC